jgi:diguanylate cyclase (GGDEF)-like protein/PAS domain S-box-containing protein
VHGRTVPSPGGDNLATSKLDLMLHSIRGKIIVGVVSLHAVLMGLVVWDTSSREQDFMRARLADQGNGLAQSLAVNAPSWLISNDVTGLNELISSLTSVHNLHLVLILDRNGKVRASTDAALFNLVLSDEPSRQLLSAATGPRQLWHDGMIDSVAEIVSAGRTIGFARVIINSNAMQGEIDAITRKGIRYVLLAIVLGGVVSWLVVSGMTRRLARLSEAADRIAAGQLDIVLPGYEGKDEVARLTRDFNQMARALADDRAQRVQVESALFAEKERAQVTLASIGDAVIVTDVASRVEFLNPVAEALTGWTSAAANGMPLGRVFHIINENSREVVENPVDAVLNRGTVVGLANHTILVRRDGVELNIEDSAAPIRDRDGEILGVVLVFHDVTKTHEMARQMSWAATHDSLTGLVNRAEFERRLEAMLGHPESERRHVLLYLDLDQFKLVNDSCGHSAGDQLLRQVSFLMQERMRETDTLARLGGDEFGVLLGNCGATQALRVAENLLETVRSFRFAWEDKSFVIGASIGLVEIRSDGLSSAQLLSAADTACYAAKDQGRNRIQVFTADDTELVRRYGEMHWAGRIDKAFDENRFRLYFQPVVPLHTDRGLERLGEILLRMVGEDGRIVAPDAFLPAAERYNLMARIDRWVVSGVLDWLAARPVADEIFSVNLSGQSVGDERFLDFVVTQLDKSGVVPRRICFEITETAAIANMAKAVRFMTVLRERGCLFSLDDFGTGLSSFGYLKNLPVDHLKIDGSFVRNILTSATDHAMVTAINNIGQVMGLRTIAEFVEDDAVRAALKEIGVDYGQGYGIARPMPIEDVAT